MRITDAMTATVIRLNARVQELAADETGDGPTDNSILIGIGAAAAVTLGGVITAAVLKYTGTIK